MCQQSGSDGGQKRKHEGEDSDSDPEPADDVKYVSYGPCWSSLYFTEPCLDVKILNQVLVCK